MLDRSEDGWAMDFPNGLQRMKKQNLLTAFDSLLGPPIAEEIPKGFFSVEEIARHRNLSIPSMNATLLKLSKAGKVERIQGRSPSGRVCWFYGVK